MRRGAEMPSPGQLLSTVEKLIEEANDLPDRMMNPGPSDWPDATRCSEEGECPGSLLRFLGRVRAVLCDMGRANSLRRIEKLDYWKTPDSFDSKPWIRPGSGDYKMRVPKSEARRDYDRLVRSVEVELEKARATLLLARSAVGFESPGKSTTKETLSAARPLRRATIRHFEEHKNDPDGYVYHVCAGLDDDGLPILPAWSKEMEKLGIAEKHRNWAGAYTHLRHRVEAHLSRATKKARQGTPGRTLTLNANRE